MIMTVLNITALVLSIILSWHYIKGGTMAGCGGGSPCEQVLNSRWSSIAGIVPVSGLAVGVYLALLSAGFFAGPDTEPSLRRLSWSVMLILAGSVAGSAIWFTIVQKWIIGAFCPWCTATHITGFLLSLFIIFRAHKAGYAAYEGQHHVAHPATEKPGWTGSNRMFRPAIIAGLLLAGMVLAGILPLTQSGYNPPSVYSKGKSQEIIPVIDFRTSPVAGPPDAPVKVILMFDYQCAHCQQLHFMLDNVIERFQGKLAFAICPVPLNPRCNRYIPAETEAFKNSCELARTGLAVWRAKPEAFKSFQDYMFTFESGARWRPRSPENARSKAIELAGRQEFEKAWSDPWLDEYIEKSVLLYGTTLAGGKGGVPRLFYGNRWVIPDAIDAGELEMILRNTLGVDPAR